MAEQDWSKVKKTQNMVDYVYAKYENRWKQSDEVTDEMLADLYNYAMLKGKFLSMVESSKATYKGYTKLLVIDEMV
nr:peptidase C48, SUMO/sentrin/Ubl1 [Tanacetum cinerariifolium]